jgi:hypothetical protein
MKSIVKLFAGTLTVAVSITLRIVGEQIVRKATNESINLGRYRNKTRDFQEEIQSSYRYDDSHIHK